jgi:hypothetical protein
VMDRPKLEAMMESAKRVTEGVPSWLLQKRSPGMMAEPSPSPTRWVTAIDELGQHGATLVVYPCADDAEAAIVAFNAGQRSEYAHVRIRTEVPPMDGDRPVRVVTEKNTAMYVLGGFGPEQDVKVEGWSNLPTFTANMVITQDQRLIERAEGLLRADPSGSKLREFALQEMKRPRSAFDDAFRDMRSDIPKINWAEIASDLCETFNIERKIDGPQLGGGFGL